MHEKEGKKDIDLKLDAEETEKRIEEYLHYYGEYQQPYTYPTDELLYQSVPQPNSEPVV